MLPAIAIALFLIAMLITAARVLPEDSDQGVLRHTIDINLNILAAELDRLEEDLLLLPDTLCRQNALQLMHEAGEMAAAASLSMQKKDRSLEQILAQVFAAMNKSSQARRIQIACKPQV